LVKVFSGSMRDLEYPGTNHIFKALAFCPLNDLLVEAFSLTGNAHAQRGGRMRTMPLEADVANHRAGSRVIPRRP
jgi:hypothetical protein